MPSSVDMPLGSVHDFRSEQPMAFRRRRFWFFEFLIGPFRDIDARAVEDTTPRKPPKQRKR